jgi:serine/threonine-protein kinase
MSTTATVMLEHLFEHTGNEIINFTIASSQYAVLKSEEGTVEQVPLESGYHRGDKVAEGGMSNIYLGHQRTLNRRIAIKENKNHRASQNQALLHESLITARLEHPNIMPIYDIFQEGEQYQVVLKWLEGFTLSDKLEEWREYEMEIEQSIPVLLKVCDALMYAHEQGILHRDIKSENIMIGDHGAIYLLDWGIALDLNNKEASSNMVVGTLCYMAPEMLSDDPLNTVSERSDVFLLGATLHEIITGEKFHNAPTPSGVVQQVLTCEPKEYDPEF